MAKRNQQQNDESLRRLFRLLPSINDLLITPSYQQILSCYGRKSLLIAAREAIAELRVEISSGELTDTALQQKIELLPESISEQLASGRRYSLRPVINATGVILHTNLGRAPLSNAALAHLVEVARGYCNLELDLESGSRSRRDMHTETNLLRVLNGGTAADLNRYGVIIVNNCSAATILALNSLAEDAEVVVSRSELVEIGGGFRIPEIMEKSGAILKEVGTTNRTRLTDYEHAIGPQTGLILRVHQSNFSIDGFSERPLLQDLVVLSKRSGIPLFEDQGTGLVSSLEQYGIDEEPSLQNSFESGVDLIAASGDKLLGGPQCGILVGRKDLIERIRKNPLLRAFRVDKLTYAALEATLLEHLSGDPTSIPVERMLSLKPGEMMRRCSKILEMFDSPRCVLEVVSVDSLVGGGTAPKASIPSYAIALQHGSLSAVETLAALRDLEPPIVGRIADDTVLLDLRTVPSDFDIELASLLSNL